MKIRLDGINNTFESYQSLISLYEGHKGKMFSDIHLELTYFFSANMCAALGAILDLFKAELNDVHFDYISPRIETILQKNDFLTYYGRNRAIDTNNTTIRFQKLNINDGKFFKNYVIDELIEGHKYDLPSMSQGVKAKIIEAIYEIFVNAQMHSESKFIYTCGQFYPNKNSIEFTIVDTGIGFKNRINKRFNTEISAEQAIRWAVKNRNTTKEGVSGGLGLAILKEFIQKNNGKVQIVSNEGFYQLDALKEVTKEFHGEFPGTIVNLQFNTADKTNYSLKGEVDLDDIF